jgi:hypothetical protein
VSTEGGDHPSAGELLDRDLKELGWSVRRLAREMLPPEAQANQVENRRRLITKWIAGPGPNDANAERAAEVLGKPRDRYKTMRSYARERTLGMKKLSDRVAELERRLDALENPPRAASA